MLHCAQEAESEQCFEISRVCSVVCDRFLSNDRDQQRFRSVAGYNFCVTLLSFETFLQHLILMFQYVDESVWNLGM